MVGLLDLVVYFEQKLNFGTFSAHWFHYTKKKGSNRLILLYLHFTLSFHLSLSAVETAKRCKTYCERLVLWLVSFRMILDNSNNDLWRIWLCGLHVPLSRTLSTYSRLWLMPCWWMLLSDASSPRKLFMLLLNWPTSTLWNRKVCNDKPFTYHYSRCPKMARCSLMSYG